MKTRLKTGSLPDIALRIVIIIGQLGLAVGLSTIALLRPQLPDGLAGLQSLIGEAQQANAAYTPPALGAPTAVLTVTKQVNGVQPTGQIYSITLDGPSFTPPSATTILAGQSLTFSVAPGIYTVSFSAPAGYTFTVPGVNAGSDTDSNANPITGVAAPVELVPGLFNPTIDAGLWQPGGLGDRVWYDSDHDGVQETGEPGVPGIPVTLQTPTGTLVTVTDPSGFYTFTNLLPNAPYTVSFGVPQDYTFTVPTVGNPATDSNVVPGIGSVPVTLAPGQTDLTIDAGLWMPPPSVVLEKQAQLANNSARPGDLVTFTLVVRNDGPGVARTLVISDPLPNGLTYVAGSAVPAAQVNGQVVVWTMPSLGVGERFTMTLVTQIQHSDDPNRTQLVNVGYVFAVGPENELVGLPSAPVGTADEAGVPLEPTTVVLTLFRSTWLEDGLGVNVVWETGSEIDTFGFSLYRSADGNRDHAVLVTPELIASTSVNNGGARYQFVDTTAVPGPTYTYWLQELETTGATNEYGPVDTDGREIVRRIKQQLFMPVLMQ